MKTRYVKDDAGHIYIYLEQYEAMIGKTLVFCDPPDRSVVLSRLVLIQDITALQEAAAALGCEIPDTMRLAAARKFVEAFLFPD